jgi:hypothetical protein
MAWRAIGSQDWSNFLREFGERHRGWLVRFNGTISAPPQPVALRGLWLEDVDEGVDEGAVVIAVGSGEVPTLLRFAGPRTVCVDLSRRAAERALAFEGLGGELTLRLRSQQAAA